MNHEFLKRRSDLLRRLRAFFSERGFLEVETPLVESEVIPERHIGLFGVEGGGWLQASPEMNHKRLLCEGVGPIFEVTRSFRRGEAGDRHRPEFTLVEWYRPGDDLSVGMSLLDQLIQTLLATPPARRTTYRAAFKAALGVDPHAATDETLAALAIERVGQRFEERDELLNALLAVAVEPTLGATRPELLYHYPASQAALATTACDERGDAVAERFELYYRGVELANGYHELTDATELRRRLVEANEQRAKQGSEVLPLPEKLLTAMELPGLPPCAGVALGFDRLVMLATGAQSIDEIAF